MAIVEAPTVSYWLTYAAIWAHHSANDCGLGGYVNLRITNLTTGIVELNYNLGMTATLDYEGAAVSYGTPYHIQADLHSATGELLASSGVDVITSPRL